VTKEFFRLKLIWIYGDIRNATILPLPSADASSPEDCKPKWAQIKEVGSPPTGW